MTSLDGRVALVTGGARGIGAAVVANLAAEGASVVIADIDELGAKSVADAVHAAGGEATAIAVDLAEETSILALVAATVDRYGAIDILVNNAALTDSGVLAEDTEVTKTEAAVWDRMFSVNLRSQFLMAKHVLPHMLRQFLGRFVTITSGARLGATHNVPYGVSKGAVWSFVQALGNAYPDKNVFVNGVEPGRALTQMVIPRFDQAHLDNPPGVPIGRYSDANEVAEVIEFLTSERNTYTTGAVWSSKGASGWS